MRNRTGNIRSSGENRIRSILFTLRVKYDEEVEMEGLVNPKTKQKLRFDFFLPEYNVAIEYDGSHHYTPKSKYNGGCTKKFVKQKIRDGIKNKYCKENNIVLLRFNKSDYKKMGVLIKRTLDKQKLKQNGQI